MRLEAQLLLPTATMPTRSTPGAAGLDLYAAENVVIKAGEWSTVETGVALSLPADHVGLIWPRSGWAAKYGLDTLAGVVDCDYRGGVGVVLVNHSDRDIRIDIGDRIAQLVIQRYEYFDPVEVERLGHTHRSVRGFGSTGL